MNLQIALLSTVPTGCTTEHILNGCTRKEVNVNVCDSLSNREIIQENAMRKLSNEKFVGILLVRKFIPEINYEQRYLIKIDDSHTDLVEQLIYIRRLIEATMKRRRFWIPFGNDAIFNGFYLFSTIIPEREFGRYLFKIIDFEFFEKEARIRVVITKDLSPPRISLSFPLSSSDGNLWYCDEEKLIECLMQVIEDYRFKRYVENFNNESREKKMQNNNALALVLPSFQAKIDSLKPALFLDQPPLFDKIINCDKTRAYFKCTDCTLYSYSRNAVWNHFKAEHTFLYRFEEFLRSVIFVLFTVLFLLGLFLVGFANASIFSKDVVAIVFSFLILLCFVYILTEFLSLIQTVCSIIINWVCQEA